jgi:hypothetical protein
MAPAESGRHHLQENKENMNRKNFFASFVMLVALASATFAQTVTPSSCPNQVTFGQQAGGPVDPSAQAQVDITYFTTSDPNAFISERAGIHNSASSTVQGTNEFLAALRGLEREGLASVQKRQSATSYMGEVAALNLERDAVNMDGRVVNASTAPASDYTLDRETEVSVTRNAKRDGDYYRLNLISWYVEATAAKGGFKTVDHDASLLLKPGQTVIVKLFSDFEVKRGGAGRKYMAVTLRSAGPVALASAR